MNRIPDEAESEVREARRVIVVYESTTAREGAAHFCGELAGQYSNEPEFHIEWWPFTLVAEAGQCGELAGKAAGADFVVFAVSPQGDLPRELKLWIEDWLAKRGEREGTLVGLMEQHPSPFEIASLKEIYLRHVAHRAGLDYLSHVPPRKSKTLPDSLDSYQQRAGQITSVLDEILHSPPSSTPPPALR